MSPEPSVIEAVGEPVAVEPVRERLVWVDAARGYCVAAVVLFHVLLWRTSWGALTDDPVAWGFWGSVNQALGSVRMPVLLAISGLVLSRQIREGLHRSTTGFRAVSNYYLYVVWLAVYALVSFFVASPSLHHRVDGLGFFEQLLVPDTTLWYIYALALYIPLLALARHVPPWLVVSLLTVLAVVVHLHDADALALKTPGLFVFFAVGVYGSDRLRALAGAATWWRLAAAAVVAAGIAALGALTTSAVQDAVLFVPRGVAFAVVCVVAVAIAVRWRPVRRLGLALGRKTLGVYVQHPLWLALVTGIAAAFGRELVATVLASRAGALLFPMVVTAIVVGLSIGTQVVAERAGLRFLFELPARWRHAFGRT
ncbi:acyltransferase family protein [Cellulomonas sp. JH27-2]|uniref:acyltransferase family protein n=1 Tax=Cellulomonas sp. JH27-2 TaxID=2774139 RepID=UPI001784B3B9|nr:acyltransferase family protein [Cellulomonas sp. JH27-2]MBD8059615.1 acyltransferase family protein [Cellulomonas sp. JH27-2]